MAACRRGLHGLRLLLRKPTSIAHTAGSFPLLHEVEAQTLGFRVLRGFAACSWRVRSAYLHGTGQRWCEQEENVAGLSCVGSIRTVSGEEAVRSHVGFRNRNLWKDGRVREAKFVEKICGVLKRGEWGIDTVNDLEKMRIRLRSKLMNKVLRQVDDPELASFFFQWARKQPSFHPSLQTYNAIIEIMGAAQNFDAQKHLLQDMHGQGVQANTSTFNILLLGYSRVNDTDRVMETFKQMEQYGWSPNAFTFKCVIRSLVWSGRALEALSIYPKMMEFGYVPDNFTYNGLIEGLCKAGHVNEAFVIFQEMEDRGLSPDAIAHAALIKGLDTKGRIDEACRMFQEMTLKNLRTVVHTHKGVMGVFSKRHKEALSSDAASAGA
ncbi:pentatricopeptide repeat-containing protein At4g26680, mitochondrial-like [Physcomitrium patens]|nr:pentatricopeptide repeat-containing protein At1g18900-like [Physcomitrium patens]BBU25487.1 pentatricopeptide repeat protein [Physcomitrium patens]|eukprot:XP_024369648.1 pentatricopeptide repeat-containing protein At1g18900-like [Physcomitrella patens]